MKLQEIMRAQIDAAINGLSRIGSKLAVVDAHDEFDRVEMDLERIASHLQDIQFNCLSLKLNGGRDRR